MNTLNINNTYAHKVQPKVKITKVIDKKTNEDGTTQYAGTVTFLNHVGAECIMTVDQFTDTYQTQSITTPSIK
jgi:hypothetical protein